MMCRANQIIFRWSSSGNYYVLASNHSMQIFELSNAKCIHELKSSHLIVTIKSLPLIHSSSNDEYIVAGDTSGFISIYSLLTGSLITRFKVCVIVKLYFFIQLTKE